MDFTMLVGIGVSLSAILLSIGFMDITGSGFDMTSLSIFLDIRSFMLVMGGTFGATITQYPLSLIFSVVNMVWRTVMHKSPSHSRIITLMAKMSHQARKNGIASLQEMVPALYSPFSRKGLQLTIDGIDPASIKSILDAEIDNMQVRHERGVNVLESMAMYAPALGMMGTVVGLVQMLRGMNDPSGIGPKMALALITTFYGVVLANLIFLPLAGRLRLRSREEIFSMEIELEGILGIASGENPKVLYAKLTSFQSYKDRKRVDQWLAKR